MVEPTLKQIVKKVGKQGRFFSPALLPKGVERGPMGKCFDICILHALANKKFRYVEGIARPIGSKQWYLHAWLTDGAYAFDPTWKALDEHKNEKVPPIEYIGIEMDAHAVAAFMLDTKYCCVLKNGYRSPALAAAATLK